MHPKDLAERGIEDGSVVRVTSRVGAVDVEVSAVDDMMPGVVSLPHGYGHQVAGTQLRHAATVAGNPVLSTPDGPGLARAFDGLDFMVAVDIYLNETTPGIMSSTALSCSSPSPTG